jgi:hypothetical protein
MTLWDFQSFYHEISTPPREKAGKRASPKHVPNHHPVNVPSHHPIQVPSHTSSRSSPLVPGSALAGHGSHAWSAIACCTLSIDAPSTLYRIPSVPPRATSKITSQAHWDRRNSPALVAQVAISSCDEKNVYEEPERSFASFIERICERVVVARGLVSWVTLTD